MLMFIMLFFFFKQKTAYEMRISDWSSDVCSSDLARFDPKQTQRPLEPCPAAPWCLCSHNPLQIFERTSPAIRSDAQNSEWTTRSIASSLVGTPNCRGSRAACLRSEEHTSALESLMRISYPICCLKKKIRQKKTTNTSTHIY